MSEKPNKTEQLRADAGGPSRALRRSADGKGRERKIIKTYYLHFRCISRHLDMNQTLDTLTAEDLENLISA